MDAPRLYTDLAPWWQQVTRFEDYAEEAAIFRHALEAHAVGAIETVLELGSGGGNNARHLKSHFRLTLADRAPAMLDESRKLNPECEHVEGDMRSLRLDRTFDAVFIHDAISYLLTEDDIRRTFETAAAHLDEGGVLLAVPDHTRESFRPETSHGGHDGTHRSLRYVEWVYDPDPADTTYLTAFAFLVREGRSVPRTVPDLHELGLFPERTWLARMADAGFLPQVLPFRHSEFAPEAGHVLFLGVRR